MRSKKTEAKKPVKTEAKKPVKTEVKKKEKKVKPTKNNETIFAPLNSNDRPRTTPTNLSEIKRDRL